MLETSKDLLNIVITASIAGLTIFICWAIFYLAMILRQVFKIVKEMRNRTHKIDELIKVLKNRIEHSASYLMLIGEGVKKLVEVVKEHTGGTKNKNKKICETKNKSQSKDA